LEISSEKLAISFYSGYIFIVDKQSLECEQKVYCSSAIYHLMLFGNELVASQKNGMLSFWKVKGFHLKKLISMLNDKKETNIFFHFQ
jgi:hypothetical protein